MTTVRLWRCTGCGKWSFAKRKPTRHERFIGNGTTRAAAEAIGFTVLDERESEYDHMNGFTRLGGVSVACGPFEPWTATRETT